MSAMGVAVGHDRQPNLSILVVDDHADCAASTAWLLRGYGHEVEVACDGPGALAAVQGHCPDVILLDIGLPGMDGWEVAKRLKECDRPKQPLIIAVTGY